MRSMQWQLGILGTISAFGYRHRETTKNLCQGGRSQDLPNTDFWPDQQLLINKGKFSLQPVTRAHSRIRVQLYSFFNLGRQIFRVVNAKPLPLYPGKRLDAHCSEGWVGPQSLSGRVRKTQCTPDSMARPFNPQSSLHTTSVQYRVKMAQSADKSNKCRMKKWRRS